ncbi:GntR family transcriptional regulator [Novosphingobium rosa]|uniref:GntR family transcriptional regulator n=1 Tax=Novosphingobium rosa TaxID=76978 RepID=UPI000B156784|nr:GntR family transcriptional regulator [Novosphingobium rosa]
MATVTRGGLLVQNPGDGMISLAVPTLVQRAYDHLLAMILTARIAPGERVAIDRVARDLAMSQTPIREALSQLEAERLVFKRPNIGYRACPEMGGVELRDAFALRLLVEPHAAAEAARNMGEGARTGLNHMLREMEGAAAQKGGQGRFAEALAALQRLIAIGSGNALLAGTMLSLHRRLRILHARRGPEDQRETAGEMGAVIHALVARDAARSSTLLRDHLTAAHARLEQALAAPRPA